jgi:tetratricopeptide (TPR) repeat protein
MESRLRLGKRYQLMERIGQGGMGVVYRAKDRLTDSEIALKSLLLDSKVPESELHGLTQRVQLANEFKWLSSLRHPNIVSVIDYGFDLLGQPYFTMEFLQGHSNIVEYCAKKPLHQRLGILGNVLHALAYLHRRNVIHRDLKNSNVLVRGEQVKLLDFGLVTLGGQEHANPSNIVVGTLAYLAPEAILGASPSVSSDLYAFGVLAYYALTGSLPFDKKYSSELIQDILYSPVAFPDWEQPDELRQILSKLLAKTPEERFASAHDVIMELNRIGATIPIETQQTRESYLKAAAFVGRKSESLKLKMALMAAQAGKSSAWLIAGETGIGKSRLIQELRTHALTRACTILEAEANPQSPVPYSLWRKVFGRLRLELQLDKREEALIDAVFGATEKPLENFSQRLTNLLVKHLQGQNAVLFILEDIHWADESSLELLRQVLVRLEQMPVMLVASYRSDDAPNLSKSLPVTDEILLERFKAKEIQELTEAILGYNDKRLIDLLYQETEGNLYFLVEVLRTLAEKAGTLDKIADFEWGQRIVTGGIRGIINNRLKRIPSKYMDTLQIAALMGRRVDTKLLETLCDDMEGFLQACESAAIFEVTNNEWQFSHTKLREILEDSIMPYHRGKLHQHILRSLENLYHDEAAVALVYHANAAQDTKRERKYSILAADAAFKVFSLNDAIHYYQRAIALMKNSRSKELIPLYQNLGRAFELNNQANRAEDTFQEELELGEKKGFEDLQLNALVNFACLYATPTAVFNQQKGRRFLNQALVMAEIQNNRREQARLHWASMLWNIYSDANTLRAVDDGLRALRLAQEIGDERMIAYTLHDLSRAYLFEADFERGRTLMEKACELWQRFDHLPMLTDGYGLLSVLHTFMGNYQDALALSKRAYTMANEINSGWGRSVALSYVGTIYMEQGDLPRAIEAMELCLENSELVGNHLPLVLTRSELALAYLRQGEYFKALATVKLALELASQHIHYHMLELSPKAVLAYTHFLMGDVDEARKVVDSINPPEFSFMMSPSALRLIAETRSQLALYNNEYERALKIAGGFLDVSERLGLASQLPLAHSLMARILGAMNQKDEATKHRRQSEKSQERLKVPQSLLWEYEYS